MPEFIELSQQYTRRVRLNDPHRICGTDSWRYVYDYMTMICISLQRKQDVLTTLADLSRQFLKSFFQSGDQKNLSSVSGAEHKVVANPRYACPEPSILVIHVDILARNANKVKRPSAHWGAFLPPLTQWASRADIW